jgi:signal transduction histidine kinase
MNHLKKALAYIFCLCAICTCPLSAYPEKSEADSLKLEIQTHPGTKKGVDGMNALARMFINQFDEDSARIYARKADSLSMELDYQKGMAESNFYLNVIEFRRSNYKEAMKYLLKSLALAEEIGDESLLAKGYYSCGLILSKQGKIDSALQLIYKSLDNYSKLKDSARILIIYNAIGNIHINQASYDSAAKYLVRAVQLAELSGQQQNLGSFYNNLGYVFFKMQDPRKAIAYYEKALEINLGQNNTKTAAQCYSNLGDVYLDLGDPGKALQYYNMAMQLYDQEGEIIGSADILNNIGAVYFKDEKYPEALENFNKAYQLYFSQDYLEGITISLLNIGTIYSKLGRFQMADDTLASALDKATQAGYLDNRKQILWAIQQNYREWGKPDKALLYYDEYFSLYDSLLNVEKFKAVNELERKYEKEKDQARILSLEKENLKKTIQRNAILYGAIGLVMLALFLVLYLRQRIYKNKIIAEQKIRQLEEEKKLLSAKLLVEGQEEERKRIARELHDGLGVLLSATKMQFSSLKLSLPENKELFDRAIKLLEQATGDVRKISHNMMPGLLTKLGFYEAVEDLIDNVKDTPGLHAECIIEGDQHRLPENKEIMLYRVVQEMVNNTIRHAGAKGITLQITRDGNELLLIYKDDGVGFDVEKALESPAASLGLKSIQSRVGFLNGELKIDSAPGQGVRYTIILPL